MDRRRPPLWHRFEITAIESRLVNQKATTDPTDQSFLIANFRELPEATRKYLIWASFFGTTSVTSHVGRGPSMLTLYPQVHGERGRNSHGVGGLE